MLNTLRKNNSYRRHRGTVHLLLVLALLFLLGHESQHDLPTLSKVDNTQCAFCLNGTGPLGITSAATIHIEHSFEFFVRPLGEPHVPQSFLGFSFSSRAPPAA